MIRHLFFCLTIATMGLLAIDQLTASEAEQPNIIFMMADDHTSQAWGCYGSRLAPFAKTPHIDRLAREGARLSNCFCTNSICVPSRASILTGQYSHVNGVKTLREALDPGTDNVAKRLQGAGYQTALVGKWHLKKPPAGFDYWNVIRGQGRYHNPVMFEMDLDKGAVQEGAYSTDIFTDKALGWLNGRAGEKPFCLMLHFKATHEPWNYHPRHASLYEDMDLPEPETLFGQTGPQGSVVPGWPLETLTQRMLRGRHGGGKLRVDSDDPQIVRRATYQKFVKDFLRCAAAIDENIGRVLDYLDQHQLAKNTLVIYTSDQGYFLGEHNYFDKRFMLEESLRMPFVVRYPAEIKPGTVVDDIVLNVDFAPTFLDYAKENVPATMQGRSFRDILVGQTPTDWRDAMYYRYYADSPQRPAHFGIRTDQHKLICYDGLQNRPAEQRWELYDLARDPLETRNVYNDATYGRIVKQLKARLQELQTEVGDEP
jgi:arylsulfatase A-like enzyme